MHLNRLNAARHEEDDIESDMCVEVDEEDLDIATADTGVDLESWNDVVGWTVKGDMNTSVYMPKHNLPCRRRLTKACPNLVPTQTGPPSPFSTRNPTILTRSQSTTTYWGQLRAHSMSAVMPLSRWTSTRGPFTSM